MTKVLYYALRFFAYIQRFSLRTFSIRGSYHPSKISKRTGRRSSSIERMEAVSNKIAKSGVSVLDIGCAEGLFSLGLAQRGCTVLGVEGKLTRVVQAYADAAKNGLSRVTFMNLNVNSDFIKSLPKFDYVLLLAVWHHMVKRESLTVATENLKYLWDKSNIGLVFETGLEELSDDYKLKGWNEEKLKKYLAETLNPKDLVEIGRFYSFDKSAFTSKKVKSEGNFKRPIFLLTK